MQVSGHLVIDWTSLPECMMTVLWGWLSYSRPPGPSLIPDTSIWCPHDMVHPPLVLEKTIDNACIDILILMIMYIFPCVWEKKASADWDSLNWYQEKAMAPHSSSLAWKIPWTEEPGRLQFMGSQRVRHGWGDWVCMCVYMCVCV